MKSARELVTNGSRVTLTCEGETGTGTVIACSPNQRSLAVEVDDGLRTRFGLYANYVPLLMKDDGEYHDIMGDVVVRVELAHVQ